MEELSSANESLAKLLQHAQSQVQALEKELDEKQTQEPQRGTCGATISTDREDVDGVAAKGLTGLRTHFFIRSMLARTYTIQGGGQGSGMDGAGGAADTDEGESQTTNSKTKKFWRWS